LDAVEANACAVACTIEKAWRAPFPVFFLVSCGSSQ
jgi:hypothetical protein